MEIMQRNLIIFCNSYTILILHTMYINRLCETSFLPNEKPYLAFSGSLASVKYGTRTLLTEKFEWGE